MAIEWTMLVSLSTLLREKGQEVCFWYMEPGLRPFKPGSSSRSRKENSSSPSDAGPEQLYAFWKRLDRTIDWREPQVAADN